MMRTSRWDAGEWTPSSASSSSSGSSSSFATHPSRFLVGSTTASCRPAVDSVDQMDAEAGPSRLSQAGSSSRALSSMFSAPLQVAYPSFWRSQSSSRSAAEEETISNRPRLSSSRCDQTSSPSNPSPPIAPLIVPSAAYLSPRFPVKAICETDQVASSHQQQSPAQLAQTGSEPDETDKERRRREKQDLRYVIRSGIAGGVAGCVAKTAIAPLDRVKILFQAQNPEFQKYSGHWLGVFRAAKDIVNDSGPWALFRGHSATLMRIFPYAAIKYMAYDKFHFLLMPTRDLETSSRLFIAGASSGVLSVFMTYPLELIRVRLAFETKREKASRGSLRRIIRQIYTEGSTEAPFSGDARRRAAVGNQGSSMNNASGSKAQVHSSARVSTAAPQPPPQPPSQHTSHLSVSAAQSEALARGATATTPVPPSAPTTTVQTANNLLQRYPIMKFYRGFTVTVLGMIPYAGTSFLVFGRCKRLLQSSFGVNSPNHQHHAGDASPVYTSKMFIDLTSGALAGAISQTAAYPFEVIRRRQQVAAVVRPGTMVGMWETTMWIWKTAGWRGYYTGLSIGFLKVVPMTSISFAVWLGMKRQMGI